MDSALWVAVIGRLFSVLAFLGKKRLEVRSLNIAILAGVQRLYGVVDTHRAWWVACIASNNTGLPLTPFTTPVFDAQAKNIGKVDKDVVARVVQFSDYLKLVNALQALRAAYVSSEKASLFDAQCQHLLEHALAHDRSAFTCAYARYGPIVRTPTAEAIAPAIPERGA